MVLVGLMLGLGMRQDSDGAGRVNAEAGYEAR